MTRELEFTMEKDRTKNRRSNLSGALDSLPSNENQKFQSRYQLIRNWQRHLWTTSQCTNPMIIPWKLQPPNKPNRIKKKMEKRHPIRKNSQWTLTTSQLSQYQSWKKQTRRQGPKFETKFYRPRASSQTYTLWCVQLCNDTSMRLTPI